MKILNLYAGIGGNRKLWGDKHDITAVEIVPEVAKIYQDYFPQDKVIIDDAHEYLRKHFREFDFIWASPPCPTHSVLQMVRYYDENLKYPDMTLYQEIILLQNFFKGKWVVENVKPYYKPLIQPTFIMERHCYWSSDYIFTQEHNDGSFSEIKDNVKDMEKAYNFDLSKYKNTTDLRKCLRNAVKPQDGLFIFKQITKDFKQNERKVKNV